MSIDDSLPNDVATLQSMLVAERTARLAAQSEAQYRAVLIEKLKFTIKKLRHNSSWRGIGGHNVKDRGSCILWSVVMSAGSPTLR
jgi:hypothetical protein